ncbi:MAG: hypothetical protein Ct9H300mP8_09510 [Gammaproteobacteria bacterium]|nr:MAG: hypothetical protein Ct9H300mP8_09510 [Gammaproteobacteria bacterium]
MAFETVAHGVPAASLYRTRDLYDDFVQVLSRVDALILVKIYSAGEREIPGADSEGLAAGIRQIGGLNRSLYRILAKR